MQNLLFKLLTLKHSLCSSSQNKPAVQKDATEPWQTKTLPKVTSRLPSNDARCRRKAKVIRHQGDALFSERTYLATNTDSGWRPPPNRLSERVGLSANATKRSRKSSPPDLLRPRTDVPTNRQDHEMVRDARRSTVLWSFVFLSECAS